MFHEQFAEITDTDVANNQLVSISATLPDKDDEEPVWIGQGVFFYTSPDVKRQYLKTLRDAGVHAMGRVALMHKVMFSIVGISHFKQQHYFSIQDAWSGMAKLDKTAISDTLRYCEFGFDHDATGPLVDKIEQAITESNLNTLLIPVTSESIGSSDVPTAITDAAQGSNGGWKVTLNPGTGDTLTWPEFASRKPCKGFYDMLVKVYKRYRKEFEITRDDPDHATLAAFLDTFCKDLAKAAHNDYRDELARKMNEAVMLEDDEEAGITRVYDEGSDQIAAVQTVWGIYGVYTGDVDSSEGQPGYANYINFYGPQCAVAASFGANKTRPFDLSLASELNQ